jgi:hypothetical protein
MLSINLLSVYVAQKMVEQEKGESEKN